MEEVKSPQKLQNLKDAQEKMFVSGFTFVRNAVKFDYPVVESIRSILPLCDEVVVNVGKSDDETLDLVQSISDSKIRIIETEWDEGNREKGRELARQTDIALDHCRGRWCLYAQADEVYHEKDYDAIRRAFREYDNTYNVEGLLFDYIHFYGSYQTCFYDSPVFYRFEVRAFKNHIGVRSFGDAQGFRLQGRKIRVAKAHAHVLHYGWVRPPEIMTKQKQDLDRWWHRDDWLLSNPREQKRIYDLVLGLDRYDGTHPRIMEKRVLAQSWAFDPPATVIHPGGMRELRYRLKRHLQHRGIGEYRNFKLVKPVQWKPISKEIRSACLVRIRSIGDTILTTPTFEQFKKHFPKAMLTVVVEPKCLDVVKTNPYIDEIVLYYRGPRSLGTLRQLAVRKFDVTIDVLGNARSAITSLATHAKVRIGLDQRGRRHTYTHRILVRRHNYVGLQNLEFLRPLGVESNNHRPRVSPQPEHYEKARAFFNSVNIPYGKALGLFPTASWYTKAWPSNKYVSLGKQAIMELGMQPIIFWGPVEEEQACEIQNRIGPQAACIPEAGFLSAGALFQGCRAAVGNDSVFSHLAVAMDVPSITIFGPTRESNWSPPASPRHWSICAHVDCRPCEGRDCDHRRCLEEIHVDEVLKGLRSLLRATEEGSQCDGV